MANIDLNILPNEAINQKNDTTKHVAWARGDSTTRTFKIIDDAGAAVDVSGYTQIKMTVSSLFDPADNSTQQFEIIGDLTSGANGLVTFTPTTTQTNILADTYFYDIQAEDGSTPSVISTLIKSKVHIIQDISKTVSGVATPDAGVITLLIGDSSDSGATNSIKVGDGGDLKIYHQGDHSYIAESGSGNLRLQANDLLLEDVSGNKFLKGSAGGTVQIWHNAAGHPAAKLTTSATGVEINGTVTADSYIIDDGTNKTTIVENASSDITLTLPSSTGTLATLADVQAEHTLAEMNDVNLTSPTDGSFLQYDNASSKWIDTQTIVQTAGGVNVTGTVTADGLDLNGAIDLDANGAACTINTQGGSFTVDTASNNAIFSSDNHGRQFQIICDSTNDTACPDLVLRKSQDTSGDDEFNSGNIRFENAHNDGYNQHAYATITSYIVDQGASETDRTEADAQIRFAVMDGDSSTALKNPTEKLKIYKNGVIVTGTVTADGVKLSTNKDILLGTADNFKIFTDGLNSFVRETGANGNLVLDGEAVTIRQHRAIAGNDPDQYHRYLYAQGGSVKLYHQTVDSENNNDNAYKLKTLSTGIDVNGIVNADAYTGSQTISNYVTDTAIDVTEFAGYAGKKIIYTGAASTISLPNVVAADIGKSWTIVNAGTGAITVDVDASGTAQQVRHTHAGGVNTSTNDRTIAVGGVVEIICIAENNSGITNSSAKPNYLIYGSGVI